MKYAFPREQRMLVVNGMLCLVLVLVVLQLWLLTATMNAFLGGDQAVIWPAALASLICFGLSLGLLQYLYALERPVERLVEGNPLQLSLATGSFTVCFAVFGSVSAMMPTIRERMGLSASEVGIALAVPVLLGSLGRIPLGILADRYGSRRVTIGVLICSVIAGALVGLVETYPLLLVCGFFLGVGLASFSGAAGLASGWYPPQRQGAAMGVYGMGNIGQSLAALAAPMMAAAMTYYWGFGFFAVLAFVWLIAFWMLAKDGRRAPPKTLTQALEPLRSQMTWILSLYYFLTFGGLVAMGLFLPVLLTEVFPSQLLEGAGKFDAGFRAAGFAALATLLRPVGGSLADRVGGQKVLIWVFPAVAVLALCMAGALALDTPSLFLFSVGALGMAAAIGLGNGAVFKLVPQYFPQSVGSVTGLVGAAGGLGGFFPPLVIGVLREATGTYTWGFVLLALFSAGCFAVCLQQGARSTKPAVAAA
jgi:NNP family nitrate/nitrite transporter-like MFS transporter